MNMAYQLLKYLYDENFGVENVDLFLAYKPETPDNCIVIYDEQPNNLPESSSLSVDNYGIQILVRNTNYLTASEKIWDIHKKITGFGGDKLTSSGNQISYITVITPPFSMGKDESEKSRNEWTAHYNIRATSEGDSNRL